MSNKQTSIQRVGETAYNQMEKMNPELFSLTYGAFVMQLIKDHRDIPTVNNELFKFGYNMGIRIIDEFLAKSGVESCKDFSETVQSIAKIALKMFLGVNADISKQSADGSMLGKITIHKTFHITLQHNPLTDFVILPQSCEGLIYSNVLCGAITGALRMVQLVVECSWTKDKLKGDRDDEISIQLLEIVVDKFYDEDE